MTSLASPIITARRPGWVIEPLPFDTVPKMFWQRVKQLGPAIMMRQKDLRGCCDIVCDGAHSAASTLR